MGVAALSVLAELTDVVGVVAHPLDPEDGCRYQSVFEWARERGLQVIRGNGRDANVGEFIVRVAPDLIWITDYRYLLPSHLLKIAPLGVINLHPSLLPKYRGRAPINWAILSGETEFGLTAHFVDEGMDTGDIIEQERFPLSQEEDVGDALRKLLPIYASVTARIINKLQAGHLERRIQDHSAATSFPARKPEDGLIDWRQSAITILNLIRAVAAPYPGAFSYLANQKVLVWKAELAQAAEGAIAGTIVGHERGAPLIACGEGALILRKLEFENASNQRLLVVGEKFSRETA